MTGQRETSSSSNHEAPIPVELEATWEPHPEWPGGRQDPDCGVLRVIVAGTPEEEEVNNQIVGDVLPVDKADGIKTAVMHSAYLDDQYRYEHKGTGSRMFRTFTRLAISHGAMRLAAINPTAAAMRTWLRVFEPDRMTYYERVGLENDDKELVTARIISAEEVRQRFEARERFHVYTAELRQKYTDYRTQSTDQEQAQLAEYQVSIKPFLVMTDLTGLDTSGWEPGIEEEVI